MRPLSQFEFEDPDSDYNERFCHLSNNTPICILCILDEDVQGFLILQILNYFMLSLTRPSQLLRKFGHFVFTYLA